jgi:hypothetical protein
MGAERTSYLYKARLVLRWYSRGSVRSVGGERNGKKRGQNTVERRRVSR